VDLGSGDGRGPYRWASKSPQWFFLATDFNADGLRESAFRASRKPSRGGVSNLLCIAADLPELAREMPGFANRVTSILPWGSLLRALVLPETESLKHLFTLCAPNCEVEVVFSCEPRRDAAELRRLGLADLDDNHVRHVMAPAYEAAGFLLSAAVRITSADLRQYQTTWAARLSSGHDRTAWRVRFIRHE
jgi:16S rRNA (adenine(1408)-N(1))-methyltransferase